MLPFVPLSFEIYRPLKPRLRWAMACLVSFADRAGRCFPSVRTFALHAGISKSAAQRDLAELVDVGLVTRKRRKGSVYVYRIDRRFLPRMAPRKLSQSRDRQNSGASGYRWDRSTGTVPTPGTEEKPDKNNQGWARKRARFAKSVISFSEIPDERAKWEARLRSWRTSRFWLPLWGAKPGEAGCLAPAALLDGARHAR